MATSFSSAAGVSFPGLVQLSGPLNRPTTEPTNLPTTTPSTTPIPLRDPTLRAQPSNRPTVTPSTLPQGEAPQFQDQVPGSRPFSPALSPNAAFFVLQARTGDDVDTTFRIPSGYERETTASSNVNIRT